MFSINYRVLAIALAFISIFYVGKIHSQGFETLSITRCEDSAAVIALIDTVFLEGVNPTQINNISFTGEPHSVGYFEGGLLFGFSRSQGIVMSTGFAENLDNPNICGSPESDATSGMSDPDLVIAGGNATIRDACVIEFDFKPAGDSVKFNYIFGSEEYHEYIGFADIFGFFLSNEDFIVGPYAGGIGINIAEIPGTNIAVSVGTVNCGGTSPGDPCALPPGGGQNCDLLKDNISSLSPYYNQFTMDAFTFPFVAINEVEACEWYHIKLAIGDNSDQAYDTGVFLEKGSFDPGNVTDDTQYAHEIINDVLYEHCDTSEATIYFSIGSARTDPFFVPYYILLDTINGLAAADTLLDYELIDYSHPDTIYIAAGELMDSLKIIAFDDAIIEGLEHVSIRFNPLMCSGNFGAFDTTFVFISDTPELPDSSFYFTTHCENEITIGFADSIGGVLPYSYDWYTLGETTPSVQYTITGVKYDSIPCIVTDACKQQVNDTAWVTVPDLVANAGIDKSMCNVNSVSIDGSSDGAQHFSWESVPNDPTLVGQENMDTAWVSPVVETDYILTATDNCTNLDIDSVFVALDDAVANAGNDLTMCIFDTVTLVANGGPGFEWEWTAIPPDGTLTGQENNQVITVSPVAPTTYTVSVTNDCDKTATDEIVVTVNQLPVADAGPDDNSCFTEDYPLTATGGTEYLWTSVPNDPSLTSQNTLPNPVVNPPTQETYMYYVQVWDDNQCANIDSMVLQIDPVPDLSITANNTLICYGDSVTLSAIGSADYTWTAYPQDPTLIGQEGYQTITVGPLETTEYTLVGVVAGFTCPATHTQTIEVKPELLSTFDIQDNEICEGQKFSVMYNGNAQASANYIWDFNGGQVLAGSGGGPLDISWDTEGVKTIVLSVEEDGCVSDTSYTDVTVFHTPVPDFNASPFEDCVPFIVDFNNTSSNLGNNVTYHWYFGTGDESTIQSPSYSYTEPGIYTVKLEVTNEGKCLSSNTLTDYIVANETPVSNFDPDPVETVLEEPEINFLNNSTSSGTLTYFWDFGDNINTSTEESPTNIYSAVGKYFVKLLVTTVDGGCESEMEKEVTIHPDFAVYAPTAFTPNGDGVNDVFELKGVGVNSFQLQIYSRWGELIFETRDITDHWDGTYNGEPVPTGNYVYNISYTSMISREYSRHGSVVVVR